MNRVGLSVAFLSEPTTYGGVRFMIAVVVSFGRGNTYRSMANPFNSMSSLLNTNDGAEKSSGMANGIKMIYERPKMNDAPSKLNNALQMTMGGPYFRISIFLGLYLDFGYIQIEGGENGTDISHDMVFMGAGGFVGANGTVGFTQYIATSVGPIYLNPEASINVRFFLGASANPAATLESFGEDEELDGEDWGFNFEVLGSMQAGLTIGWGVYKLVGLRAYGGVVFNYGYGLNVADWFPAVGTNWGGTADATFTGSIDLVFTSIDFWSASWPTGLGFGWMEYLQEVTRANKCILYVKNGIRNGKSNEARRAECLALCDELAALVDYFDSSTAEVKAKIKTLRKKAYSYGIIDWEENNAIQMNKQAGVFGSWRNEALEGDADENYSGFHTRSHVNPQWVAGQDASLQSAFGPVHSEVIMQDAIAQPSSRILSIGGGTADSKPSLVDAGDKLILSWASIAPAKYQALLDEIAAELRAESGAAEASAMLVQEALEEDPARVMMAMDIFTVEFDKASRRFGPITQLTDDDYYDDYPQAVYDVETGDYIVLYYKTAQDTEAYDSAADRLNDLVAVSPDTSKTYSILCYMLYNNQTDAADSMGRTHAPGWARDYLFANETSNDAAGQASFLARWGGQRFLPSTIRTESGAYADPPASERRRSPQPQGGREPPGGAQLRLQRLPRPAA